jgi:hypothetical protein
VIERHKGRARVDELMQFQARIGSGYSNTRNHQPLPPCATVSMRSYSCATPLSGHKVIALLRMDVGTAHNVGTAKGIVSHSIDDNLAVELSSTKRYDMDILPILTVCNGRTLEEWISALQ